MSRSDYPLTTRRKLAGDPGLRALGRRLQAGLREIEKKPAYAQGSGPSPGQSGIRQSTSSRWWNGRAAWNMRG